MYFSSLKQFFKNDRLRLFAFLVTVLIISLGAEKYLASMTSIKVKTEIKGDQASSTIESTSVVEEITATPYPTSIPSATNAFQKTTPTPNPPTITNKPVQASGDFIYPNAQKISRDDSMFTLQSNDTTQTITDWYKNKIKSKRYIATSYVATLTNGNVLNKLVASNGSSNVRIEITKESNSRVVTIQVDL